MSETPDMAPTLESSAIRFEIRDGCRRISFAVSDETLNAASGLIAPSTLMMRRKSFDRFRTLINAAAILKLKALPSGPIGPIVLTERDLRRVPPERGTPSFGTCARRMPGTAVAGGVTPSPGIAGGVNIGGKS
jgi:hypothetical protein